MTYKIFCEGKLDESFLRALVLYLNKDVPPNSFVITKGWTNLNLLENEFKKNTDNGGKNLVIFDADGEANNGGFKTRKAEILSKKESLHIEFDLFLFPNNEDDGMIENLLETIISPTHNCLMDCFDKYIDCILANSGKNGISYTSPGLEDKLYAYIDSFAMSKTKKEQIKKYNYFFEDINYWNLNHDYLIPLKAFLSERIS
jgi:hypothetical protein